MRSVEEQQARITAAAVAPRPIRVAIAEAQGLMCAEEVVTERPLPGFDQAAIDGYAVRSVSGTPLTAQSSLPIEISRDGTLTQGGQPIGQLEIADFTSTGALNKQGGNYFRAADPTVKPQAPSGTTVEQGKLEGSNTGTAESAVRLVTIMRQFEMLQKAVMIGNDMSKEAIEQVAKVGS